PPTPAPRGPGGGPAGSRCGRPCARWAAPAWPTWSSAAAATPAASPTCWGRPRGSRSSTRSCSTRSWSASPTPAATATAAPARSSAGSRRTAPFGWAAPPGTTWRPCASRSRPGPPPTTTSTARQRPSWPRPGRPAEGATMASDEALAVYLNDHLAGSAAGVELAEKLRDNNQGTELGKAMVALHHDITEDRETLKELMRHLDVERH